MEKRGWRIDNTLCFAHHYKNVHKSVVTVGQGPVWLLVGV